MAKRASLPWSLGLYLVLVYSSLLGSPYSRSVLHVKAYHIGLAWTVVIFPDGREGKLICVTPNQILKLRIENVITILLVLTLPKHIVDKVWISG